LYGLDTWAALAVRKGQVRLRLTAMPGRHAPGPLQRLLPPVMGSMLEFSAAGQPLLYVYITGDTLLVDALREIPRRYPHIDLALLHLGGTRILGLLMVTMDAAQGLEVLRLMQPRTAIPIHYNDYGVFKSPLRDFQRAVDAAGLAERVVYLRHGETHTFAVGGAAQAQAAHGTPA
jgi:L-ascorbate metabolism protein UlaG (beta-lactamase superfamily)